MSKVPQIEYGTNYSVAKACRKLGHDVFVMPVLDGVDVTLTYRKGKLVLDEFSEKQIAKLEACKVPKRIWDKYQPRWGHFTVKQLVVHCKYIHKHLLAVDAVPGVRLLNRLSTLNLLAAKGFKTPLKLCSWLDITTDVESKEDANKLLVNRLREINEVIAAKRPSLWWTAGSQGIVTNEFAFLDRVRYLELHDEISFRPQTDNPKALSVYKASAVKQ